jgi:competence protein ComEC
VARSGVSLGDFMARFRAYQLGSAGSSFSYWNGQTFTLLEARFNTSNAKSIVDELKACGKSNVDTLHISSWDADHCSPSELQDILKHLKPRHIEVPKYAPTSKAGIQALAIIKLVVNHPHPPSTTATAIVDDYLSILPSAVQWDSTDIHYGSGWLDDNSSNNNSSIKLFRSGNFSVLSVGDVESSDIANWLQSCPIIQREVDVMILAHHGADNGFTSAELISKINPKIAICSSNYDNQFDHPRQEIRNILYNANVPLMTTKTGDVIIAVDNKLTGQCAAWNLIANSTELSSEKSFTPKRLDRKQLESAALARLLMQSHKGNGSLLGRM